MAVILTQILVLKVGYKHNRQKNTQRRCFPPSVDERNHTWHAQNGKSSGSEHVIILPLRQAIYKQYSNTLLNRRLPTFTHFSFVDRSHEYTPAASRCRPC